MKKLLALGVVAVLASTAWAEPTLQVSLGTRETGSTAAIGDPGGTGGGIEWVNLDGQTLVLDGTWQLFSFDMDVDPITAFAGSTADGILDGTAGTIEHIRFKSTGYDGPITIWIDDVADSIVVGPIPQTITFGTFEGYTDDDEVMFQEPGFSGSTAGHIMADGDFAGVDNTVAYSGEASYKVEWQFVDSDPSRWLRLTTYSTGLGLVQGDPTIAYDQDSVVSFWIKGVPEPASLVLLALGGLLIRRR